jgi:hypothetical protein
MSTTPFVGTLTIAERLANENVLWKSICKRVAYTLRVSLPGIITAFNSVTQMCSVQLTLTENTIINEIIQATKIPVLDDVLLMLPGDSNWCITYPSLVGSECLVLFADMCVSAWSTNGGIQNQEVTRRHSLSDGFAILAPRSQPNKIPNYSTTAMEIRSMDGTVKLSFTEAGIAITSPLLSWDKTPVASFTGATLSLPITLNGVVYWLKLSVTP